MSGESALKDQASERDLDYEKDSLHILPLQMIPLETPGLGESRMIKNVQFESMIEVFQDDEAGSGQVDPARLSTMFGWPKGQKHPDGVLIAKLSLLQSFDVYSLRMSLRNLGIKVDDNSQLRLSDAKQRELNRYMKVFTRPLVNIVYSENEEAGISDIGELVSSFRGSDSKAALDNLKKLSTQLKVILGQLPAFLTDYGDVFLSLAYFKDCFDDISGKTEFFLDKLALINADPSLREVTHIMDTVTSVEAELNELMAGIAGRIESFDKHTEAMWENLNSNSFREVKLLIESNHATIGGMLCGLQIKMNGFHEEFHMKEATTRRIADYVAQNIKPGIDRINNIARSSHYANQV
jgi:hypothetical protein